MTPIQKRAERVRDIALESVLRLAGAQADVHDRHKWHTSQGVISITGPKFINWTHGIGGGGAIDLVIHLHDRGFREALEWLERHFPDALARQACERLCHRSLQLPIPSPQLLWRVETYLASQRRLPAPLIAPSIQTGLIYADAKANAVFLLLGEKTDPVGAELRGTTDRSWRGLAPGSRKDLGFFAIGSGLSRTIILCESAIDAISCYTLFPQSRCISTAGARPDPQWLSTLMRPGVQIYCGFDADPTGDAMAQAMMARHSLIQRLRPSKKDWNDLLRAG